MLKLNYYSKVFILLSLLASFCVIEIVSASTLDDIALKQKQIEEIQKQIEVYQQQIDSTRTKSGTLQSEISKLNAKISQLLLEIKSLNLSINQTSLEIVSTEGKINDAEVLLGKHINALGQYIKIINENDQRTLTEILLKNNNLSDFFNDLNSVQTTQDNLKIAIDDIKNLKIDLENKKNDLDDKKGDLQRLKSLSEIEKRNVDSDKSIKDKILKETKGQESKFQELVKKSQKDIQAIKDQIYYLQQNGVTVEDAIKYGQLAAIATGIRPAFLIAILEIESGLGKNVGTGNWMDDMYNCYLRMGSPTRAEKEKAAFLTVVQKLGLDPNSVKVSREPNYGCGGAMGPAQFIASTWLAYEERVAGITGHNPPSPWNIEDAFTASSIKLAAGGATSKDKVGETRAAKAYVSGSPTCTKAICISYANMVLRKAAEIEPNL